MNYLLLGMGFVFLIKGADFFVEGAASIAKYLRIPSLIIGLTLIAFGTSMPELAVGITSAMGGSHEITLGNVMGANLFNFLMVIGVASILQPLKVEPALLKREFPFMVMGAIILVITGITRALPREMGLAFIGLLGVYLFMLTRDIQKNRLAPEAEGVEAPLLKCLLLMVGGLVGVILGGNWVVASASQIALDLGMSQTLVGLTIVAIGTSLPELVTAIVAIKKQESEMIFGNVLGSGIFNVFLVLGTAISIREMTITAGSFHDLLMMLMMIIFVYGLSASKTITRPKGILLVGIYLGYIMFQIGVL